MEMTGLDDMDDFESTTKPDDYEDDDITDYDDVSFLSLSNTLRLGYRFESWPNTSSLT